MSLGDSLISEIVLINKFQIKFIESSLATWSEMDYARLEKYLKYCTDSGITLRYLASSYDLIVKDTLSHQIYFKRNKRYKYSTYKEVASIVYHNHDYMSMYMHGLALTSFFWPNHRRMMKYFSETIPKNNEGRYIEIGPGHGFHMIEAMRLTKYNYFLGVDISATSVKMTKAILKAHCSGETLKFDVKECNFLEWGLDEYFEAIVMGEVLEHVEQPERFLSKIRDIAHDKTYIFLTTCINSPAIDHIYLFESFDQIRSMIDKSGLYVKDFLLIPYVNLSIEESEKQKLPVNVALILGKKKHE